MTACGDTCTDLQTDVDNCGRCGTECPAGGTCTAGSCECPISQATICTSGSGSEVCADLQTDPSHCATCAKDCDFGHVNARCTGGACSVTGCAIGFADCNGDLALGAGGNGCEVNTNSSNANCGLCGVACPAGQICSNGACRGNVACAGACIADKDCYDAATYCASGTEGRKCVPLMCQSCFSQGLICSYTAGLGCTFGKCH